VPTDLPDLSPGPVLSDSHQYPPSQRGGRHSARTASDPVPQASTTSLSAQAPRQVTPPAQPQMCWRVVSGGQVVGDFPEQRILSWVANRQMKPDDHVWRPGMAAFALVSSVSPFAQYFPPGVNPPPTPSLGDDAAMRWLLPVGRAPWAIAAGYLGLLSILLVFAPFAVIAGILGLRQINRNPQQHGIGRAIFGIAAGALAIVIGAAIALS
jgi:Domain of unknown function (DUF4190)/GYF domain 2